MQVYQLYGLRWQTGFSFANRLIVSSRTGSSGTTFDYELRVEVGPWQEPRQLGELRYSSPYVRQGGAPWCQLFDNGQRQCLRIPDVADYRFARRRIDCFVRPESSLTDAEIHLLGAVSSYLLESRGVLALHASALRVGDRAVGILSGNAGGKTGLAAALLQRGHALMSDDILPVEDCPHGFVGHAGYPQMRMWPDQAAHFGLGWQQLPIVHPAHDKRRVDVGLAGGLGRFETGSAPLSALYVADRRPAGELEHPLIEPLRPTEALRELLRNSFTPYVVEAVGLREARLARLARLVEAVGLRRLSFPSGFDRLAEVARAIEADLAAG